MQFYSYLRNGLFSKKNVPNIRIICAVIKRMNNSKFCFDVCAKITEHCKIVAPESTAAAANIHRSCISFIVFFTPLSELFYDLPWYYICVAVYTRKCLEKKPHGCGEC